MRAFVMLWMLAAACGRDPDAEACRPYCELLEECTMDVDVAECRRSCVDELDALDGDCEDHVYALYRCAGDLSCDELRAPIEDSSCAEEDERAAVCR